MSVMVNLWLSVLDVEHLHRQMAAEAIGACMKSLFPFLFRYHRKFDVHFSHHVNYSFVLEKSVMSYFGHVT